MNAWLEEALNILNVIVRKPDTPVETAVTAVLVLALFLTIMWLAGLAFKMPDTNLMQRLLAGIVVFIAGLAAATAASVLTAQKIEKEIVQKSIIIAAPIVATLAIGVPLAMLTMRAKYFQTLFTVCLSIAAAWGVSLLSETVFDSIRAGKAQADKAADRKDQINQILDNNSKPPSKVTPKDDKATEADPRGYTIYRSKRAIENQKRDEEKAAAEKAAREKALREKFK